VDEAAAWTQNYRNANPEGIKAHFFGRKILEDILKQGNCVGIRMYYALDASGVQQLVIVGADANENDLHTGIVAERSKPCPTSCDNSLSPLNG